MKKKLLLADDSITIQKVIAITFSSDDYTLTVVDNGLAALDKARAERPDLVMADVFMPGKNGYEVCAAIKGDPALRGVPVLLLTGTFEPFDEDKARQVGADKWIAKPFESQRLIDNVEELLAKAAQAPVVPPVAAPAPPVFSEAPARPMPGTPVPPQPAAVVPPQAAAPVRPMPGAPVPPAAPVSVPVAAPAPEPEPPLEEDIWGAGDELSTSFGELSGPDEFAPGQALTPAGAEDDLWGSVSFDEVPPAVESEPALEESWGAMDQEFAAEPVLAPAVAAIEPAAEDSWGTLEQDFAESPLAPEPGPVEIPLADTSMWGEIEEDLTSPQPEPIVPLAAGGWTADEDLVSLDEVEILEEVDLGGAAEIFPEPVAEAGGSLELAGFETMARDEALWEEPAAPAAETIPFMEDAFAGAAEAPIAPRTAPAAVEERVAALSEDELARIVESVSGAVIERLASTILEKVAWEVVPDLAEALIKAELAKIRDEVASKG